MAVENPGSDKQAFIDKGARIDNENPTLDTWDLIEMYFREVNEFPLLDPVEERKLTAIMASGRTFDGKTKTLGTMHLTPEAADAYDILITSNLRLVVSRAKRNQRRGIPFLELINIGNIGLMKGITKFEPERGNKLSTYCTWWIDQAIGREIRNSGQAIRIPVHFYDWVQYVKREKNNLNQTLGREPTIDELAVAVGSDPTFLEDALNIATKPASFSLPLDGEDSNSEELGDRLFEEVPSFEQGSVTNEARERVRNAYLSIPDERERAIIGLRYGFIDGKDHTLDEVGKALKLTRERVRQLEVRAKDYLRRRFRRNLITKEDIYDY